MKTKPELLQHPNIPKPLHGVTPRLILGKDWWNKMRKKSYASTNYHCLACGIHSSKAKYRKRLEAHESYNIDYENGILKMESIVPLCHSCHGFIHSGRLYATLTDKNKKKACDILTHGLSILKKHDLDAFPGTIEVANELNVDHECNAYELPKKQAEWKQWKLLLNGKEYHSHFKNLKDWESHHQMNHI